MPIQDKTPQEAVKPKTSNTSTPAPDPGDEWFEDVIIRALDTYNRTHPQSAQ